MLPLPRVQVYTGGKGGEREMTRQSAQSACFWAWAEQERRRRGVNWPDDIAALCRSKARPSPRDCVAIAYTLYDVHSSEVLREAGYPSSFRQDWQINALEFEHWRERHPTWYSTWFDSPGWLVVNSILSLGMVILARRAGLLPPALDWMFDNIPAAILLYLALGVFPFAGILVLTNVIHRRLIEDRQRRIFEAERAEREAAISERNRRNAERRARIEAARRREEELRQARRIIAERVARREAERALERERRAREKATRVREAVLWAIAVPLAVLSLLGDILRDILWEIYRIYRLIREVKAR